MSRWRLLAGLAGDRLWRATVPACWRRCWWAPWGCAT